MLKLRTLMIHEKPVEIVYDRGHTPADVAACIRGRNVIEAQIHPIGGIQEMSMLKGIAEVKRYFLPGMPIPNVIREMQCNRWG